jgi:putative transcriptional regulator
MARHHPAPELLTAFSAGSLPLSHALCVSTHIERCQECQINVQRLNSFGAKMFEALPTHAVSENLKARVFEQLDTTVTAPEPMRANRHSRIPKALQQFISGDYDSLKWKHASSSIKVAGLCVDNNGARVEMVRIKPGGKVATHTHTGDEYTVVLEGSFSDEQGLYAEGDFIVRDGSHRHKPIASKDKECVCLTVTDAPIEFTGFIFRWLNPFIRRNYLTS